MEYIQLTLDDWLKEKEDMRTDLQTAADAFIRIGCRLKKWRNEKLYERDGYKTISEMAEKEYGLKKNTTSNFIGIAEKFVIPGTMELEERYRGIGSSLLAEMLTMSEEDRELVTSDTTRAQIRDIKQFAREEPDSSLKDFDQVIVEFFRKKPSVLNAFYGSDAYITGDLEELAYIINPGGNQTFRKGLYMVFFYDQEQGIKYKVFGEAQIRHMTYERFFQRMQEVYQEAISGNRTHQEYYGEPEETGEKEKKEVPPAEPETRITTKCVAKESEKEGPEETSIKKTEETQKTEPISEESSPAEYPEPAQTEEIEEKPEAETAKNPEMPIKTECEEQLPGQTSIEEDLPELVPEGSVEVIPEVMEKPFGSRKDYIDTLTAWGMAQEMAELMKERLHENLADLTETDFWEKWLKEPVDVNGEAYEA